MASGKVEYIRLPLTRGRKALLRRLADREHRTLGQMAALLVIEHLSADDDARRYPGGPWRTPNLIPPGG